MKKRIIPLIVFIFLLLATFLPASIVVFFTPSQYAQTFYGEFNPMLEKLANTKENKIVIIGNSSVPFGVDSALMETELKKVGLDYAVCNFGLYGALGTKFMMDEALPYIKENDIVILTPEPSAQCMSLYFSGKEIWRTADGNFSPLRHVNKSDLNQIAGTFYPFALEKTKYLFGEPLTGSGVYAASSFDENCDMKNAERANNVMSGGYDPNNLDLCDEGFLQDDFIQYVRHFSRAVRALGARTYFTFAPLNQSAVNAIGEEKVNNYFTTLQTKLHLRMLGDPTDFIYPAGWFYDSNVHLNSSGMILHTVNLIEAIKLRFKITTPCEVEVPPMPEFQPQEEVFIGDDSNADCFEYEENNGEYVITALSEKGKCMQQLTIPSHYNGKRVKTFTTEVFKDNKVIQKIVIQRNIVRLYDRCFDGCVNLQALVIDQTTPAKISVGMNLLQGAPNMKIYVPKDGIASYISDYFWSKYAERLEVKTDETN